MFAVRKDTQNKGLMIIQVLEHRIRKAEPCVLINKNILINMPTLPKNIEIDNILLTHAHQENIAGFNQIIKRKNKLTTIYVHKDHERALTHFTPNLADKCVIKHITPNKKFKIGNITVQPIHVRHTVQKSYGSLCLAFLLNERILYCSPCNDIPKKNFKYFKNLDVLILDGGYRGRAKYKDHLSMSTTLSILKDFNIKYLYFLGTHKDYRLRGKIKNRKIQIDTLFTGDIIKVK